MRTGEEGFAGRKGTAKREFLWVARLLGVGRERAKKKSNR